MTNLLSVVFFGLVATDSQQPAALVVEGTLLQ